MYVGVSNKARKVSKMYVGVDGTPKLVKKIYAGINGVAEKVFEHLAYTEEIVYTTTQTITVPSDVRKIDIFCVGGGGGGGGFVFVLTTGNYLYFLNAPSGGSGYTHTENNVVVAPGDELTISIGAGGSGGTSYENMAASGSFSLADMTAGTAGGTTSVKKGTTTLCSASGGSGGAKRTGITASALQGSNGGSGSGCAGCQVGPGSGSLTEYVQQTASGSPNSSSNYGLNGVNGGNGGKLCKLVGGSLSASNQGTPGTGQGTTTRAFGIDDSSQTMYSQIIDTNGNSMIGTAGAANTGNSGGPGKAGGSGIVIIRYHHGE